MRATQGAAAHQDDDADPLYHRGRARLVRNATVGRARRVVARKGQVLTMIRRSAVKGRPDFGVSHFSPDLGAEDSYFSFSFTHFEWLPGEEPPTRRREGKSPS